MTRPRLALALAVALAVGPVLAQPAQAPDGAPEAANPPAAPPGEPTSPAEPGPAALPDSEPTAEPEVEPSAEATAEAPTEDGIPIPPETPPAPAPRSRGPEAPAPMRPPVRSQGDASGATPPPSSSSSGLPPPVRRPLLKDEPLDLRVDRTEEMPGSYADRPLTAPRGTLIMGLVSGSAFVNTEAYSATSPSFSLGATEDLEVGITAPLRYEQALLDWTGVEPTPHLAFTAFRRERFELGARASVRIPTRVDTDPLLTLAVPALFRANDALRLDAGVQAEIGFEDKTEISLGLPLSASVQLAPWFFGRVRGALDWGVTSERTTGVDAGLLVGVTHHTTGRANVDLTLEFFVENVGGGRDDRFSDGGGLQLALMFYPELY